MGKYTEKELMQAAMQARELAYTPYSNYRVGAALLCKDGKLYTGCNIENAAYTPSICAERTAFAKAVSEGKREFEAIAVVGGKAGEISEGCTPCGVCRQVMAEFCDASFKVILGTPENFRVYPFSEVLPLSFKKSEV